MWLVNYIDKKMTASLIRNWLKSFLLFGLPVGYLTSQILRILSIGWSKYHFDIIYLLFSFLNLVIFDFLIALPFIISQIRSRKKYKKLYNRIIKEYKENNIKTNKVKCIYNFEEFEKGESYEVINISIQPLKNIGEIVIIKNRLHILKDIINKFNIDDIKEERLKKLKKLKNIWRTA